MITTPLHTTRLCLVTELLDEPFDEGMKVFSLNLARYLEQHVQMLAISNSSVPPATPATLSVPFGKSMLSRRLRAALRAFEPDILLYLPKSSLTAATFLRLIALNRMVPAARLAVIGLQPRQSGLWTRAFVPLLSSLHVFTQSMKAASAMAACGFRTSRVPPGIDIVRFHPVDSTTKAALRRKFGLRSDRYTVLHVGHLAASRNLETLVEIAARPRTQVVLVASTSTPQDAGLRTALSNAGITVLDRVVPQIEELYQLSDAYVFPVLDPTGAIEMPLSVLEAMACGIQVLTTPFGDLPQLFPSVPGVVFWRTTAELMRGLDALREEAPEPTGARRAVEYFGWDSAFGQLLGMLQAEAIQ